MKKLYRVAVMVVVAVTFLAGCNQNNVTIDNSLQEYFDDNKVTGTFGMFDNGQGQFTIYNLSRFKDSAYLPASTFKIVNSLIGLETGRISGENMVIKWDSIVRRPEWDKDLTMKEAFKVSAVPYYQEVARRIGKDTMQHWLDTLGYGSKNGKAAIKQVDTFWLDNSVKITADEQLGLVKKLYFDQLPFRKQTTQEIVKRIMLQEDNSNYKLSYKTGWGTRENGNALGWIVGWIEENKHPYFFVLNLEGPKDTDPQVRINILKAVLKQYGFMEGRK